MWGVVFGGSFNPPHAGHEALVRACLGQLGPAQVYLLPLAAARLSEPAVADRAVRLLAFAAGIAAESVLVGDEASDDQSRFDGLIARIGTAGQRPVVLIGSDVLRRGAWSRGLLVNVLARADLVVGMRPGYGLSGEALADILAQAEVARRWVLMLPTESNASSSAWRMANGQG